MTWRDEFLGLLVEATRNRDVAYAGEENRKRVLRDAHYQALRTDETLLTLRSEFERWDEEISRVVQDIFPPGTILSIPALSIPAFCLVSEYLVVSNYVAPNKILLCYKVCPDLRVPKYAMKEIDPADPSITIVDPYSIADPKMREKVHKLIARIRTKDW